MPLPTFASWLPSFVPSLPALPTVPLPSNLQHRLVAFLLRRALGSFVKEESLAGWGDSSGTGKVEADVRNGRVRISDFEVDPEAINALLSSDDPDTPSLPIELVSGRLDTVTALVIYPTFSLASLSSGGVDAKLDLEVEGVELVFRVRESVEEEHEPAQQPKRPTRVRTYSSTSTASFSSSTSSSPSSPSLHSAHSRPPHLAASTLSLAAATSFLHAPDGLTACEENELRASLHLPPVEVSASVDLPGAFGGDRTRRAEEPQDERVEEVEAGLLATVVERILARLSVRVRGVAVKLVWGAGDGEHELRLEVDEVEYRGTVETGEGGAVGRSVSIKPPTVYLKRPTRSATRSTSPASSASSPPGSSPHHPTPPTLSRSRSDSSSSSSSSDEGDSDDFLAMSSAIADLRPSSASLPRSYGLGASVASSSSASSEAGGAGGSAMWQSARSVGTLREEADEETSSDDPFTNPDEEDAFATPEGSPEQNQEELAPPQPQRNDAEKGTLVVSLGTAHPLVFLLSQLPSPAASSAPRALLSANLSEPWVVALSAQQLGGLLGLVDRLVPPTSPTPSAPVPPAPSPATSGMQLDIRLASVQVLLAYPPSPTSSSVAPFEPFDAAFWVSPEQKPVGAPHFRFKLDGLGLSSPSSAAGVDLSVSSICLAETIPSSACPSGWHTLPLLVNDPNLALTALSGGSITAPAPFASDVEAVDWVQNSGKSERWSGEGRYLGGEAKKQQEEPPALRLSLDSFGGVDVGLAPLHLYVEVTLLQRVEQIFEALDLEAARTSRTARRKTEQEGTPRSGSPVGGLPPPDILDDLDGPTGRRLRRSTSIAGSGTSLQCPLVRVSVRCPSPKSPTALRSGLLLIDFEGLAASSSSSRLTASIEALTVRFAWALSSSPVLVARPLARLTPLVPLSTDSSASLPSLAIVFPSPSSGHPRVDVRLPLLHIRLDKQVWDGVQLFADDLGQSSASLAPPAGLTHAKKVEEARESWGENTLEESTATLRARADSEERTIHVSVEITDVVLDLLVGHVSPTPPPSSPSPMRHLRLLVSDVSVNIDGFKSGQDDLRTSVSVLDMRFEEVSANENRAVRTMLARTLPRNLTAPTPPSPVLALRFASSADPVYLTKSSSIEVNVGNVTGFVTSEIELVDELARFAKAPAGAFENVVPTDHTSIAVSLTSISIHATAPTLSSQAVLSLSSLSLQTDLTPHAPSTDLDVSFVGLRGWAIDSEADLVLEGAGGAKDEREWWKSRGFVQLVEVEKATVEVSVAGGTATAATKVVVSDAKVDISLCADSIGSVSRFAEDWSRAATLKSKERQPAATLTSTQRVSARKTSKDLLASVDPAAFEHAPSVHDLPEILDDDVPSNIDYLADALNQTSFKPRNARRGSSSSTAGTKPQGELISEVDGETIRMLSPRGIEVVDNWFAIPRLNEKDASNPTPKFRFSLASTDVSIHLHEGYDWSTTRKAIEEEAKAVRRRLEKIRQLLASGQTPEVTAENAPSTLLFGSLQLGLPPGASDLPPKELLAAINNELDDSPDSDAASTTSSWQTFPDGGAAPSTSSRRPAPAVVGKARKKLTRSRAYAIEFNLRGLSASLDVYPPVPPSANLGASLLYTSLLLPSTRSQLSTKLSANVAALDILDNIKTSTWRKFLTELRPSDGGLVRPTGASMAKLEVSTVRPVGGVKDAREEILLKIKVAPLRLYIDQDALDFLKAFGAFQVPASPPPADSPPPAKQEPFFQRVEVFPVKIKLDYKPKRVDYNALRSGKTAELMNFFHFDGSVMTLRHLVVTGISGTSTLSTLVQDIWTPDVKAHQLADVVSGIAPVRSVVNIGSGAANLVLLPIEQYRKDGRVVRGLQKGAQAFAKQTTLEAINVGARLANGTQVILEQAEHVLGAKFTAPVTGEAVPVSPTSMDADVEPASSDDEREKARSRYAEQPANLKQGVESAYKSLGENVKEAAQTILAVPMEVYERSGNEGPVRAVVRAVPIAVLKPMIGATGAVSKALLGLRNTLDPAAQQGEMEDKYKQSASRTG
ncbi:hypothetical protein JCM8097_005543 [Rhodosporidiobolus ruineniae]